MPFTTEWHYRIVPPEGYRPRSLPEDAELELGPAMLTRVVRAVDGAVEIDLRFDTGRRRMTPEEFTAMRQGVLALVEEDALLVELEHVGEAHLAAGEIREALTEFDRLIAAAPERALPHARRARALLEAGLGAAARREARRAIELEPQLDLAHQTLGVVLEHDLLGRQLRGEFDREEALAAFRKARELDPARTRSHGSIWRFFSSTTSKASATPSQRIWRRRSPSTGGSATSSRISAWTRIWPSRWPAPGGSTRC